ncbi:hypothetical protein [Flavobacterium sp. GCM10027622]|uniref:hypothetical protein n=1 Tax=unclassified Flavobacterium TaxID=196869 RepID=UPI00361F2437
MKKLIFLFLVTLLASCNSAKTSNGLIQDCPDEKIVNNMPSVGGTNEVKEYYIYKGKRKEIKDFDAKWVAQNCTVKTAEVY